MFKLIKNSWTLPVAIFLLGALSIIAYGIKHHTPQGIGRTVHFRQTWTANGGKVTFQAEWTKYTRADGFWKAVQTYYNDDGTVKKVDIQFGSPQKGAAFQVDEQNRLLVVTGPIYHASHSLDIAKARLDPSFVREDTLLGYPVVVFRISQDSDSYIELYRSLELDDYLKNIKANSAGYTTIEADRIILGEPTAEQLTVPDYPVSFDLYKAMIRQAERQGDQERAAAMRQTLSQLEQNLR